MDNYDIVKLEIDKYIKNLFQLANDYDKIESLKLELEQLDGIDRGAIFKEWNDFSAKIQAGVYEFAQSKEPKPNTEKTPEYKYIEKRISNVRTFQILENAGGGFTLPNSSYREWFKFYRENNFNTDIEDLNAQVENSAISKLEVCKERLQVVLNEFTPLKYIGSYVDGNYLLDGEKWGIVSDFTRDVNTIDFVKYLTKLINELENPNAVNKPKASFEWKENATLTTELIKAIIEAGSIQGLNEREIFNEFGNFFGIDLSGKDGKIQEIKKKNLDSQTAYIDRLRNSMIQYLGK